MARNTLTVVHYPVSGQGNKSHRLGYQQLIDFLVRESCLQSSELLLSETMSSTGRWSLV